MRTWTVGVALVVLSLSNTARAGEAEAVEAIEKQGGTVRRDRTVAGKPVVEVDLHLCTVNGEVLGRLKDLTALRHLNLAGTSVTDADLKVLRDLRGLTYLNLSSTKVTDKGLVELRGLKKLETLRLNHVGLTDTGLKELKDLKHLKDLFLQVTKATKEGVADLQKALPECDISTVAPPP